nr:uncharacterized protein LOC125184938 [Anser cygnoides]
MKQLLRKKLHGVFWSEKECEALCKYDACLTAISGELRACNNGKGSILVIEVRLFSPSPLPPGGSSLSPCPRPLPGLCPQGCPRPAAGRPPAPGAALRPLPHLPAPAGGAVASGSGASRRAGAAAPVPGLRGALPGPTGRRGGSGDAVASGAVWRSPLTGSCEGAGGFLRWELRETGTLWLLGAARLVRAKATRSTSLPGLDSSIPQKDPKFYLRQHRFICVAASSFHESGRQTRASDPDLRCRKSGVKKAPVAPADFY